MLMLSQFESELTQTQECKAILATSRIKHIQLNCEASNVPKLLSSIIMLECTLHDESVTDDRDGIRASSQVAVASNVSNHHGNLK